MGRGSPRPLSSMIYHTHSRSSAISISMQNSSKCSSGISTRYDISLMAESAQQLTSLHLINEPIAAIQSRSASLANWYNGAQKYTSGPWMSTPIETTRLFSISALQSFSGGIFHSVHEDAINRGFNQSADKHIIKQKVTVE